MDDTTVLPPLPQQAPVSLDERRQAREADGLVAELLEKVRSGGIDGATMMEFSSKFTDLIRSQPPSAAAGIDDTSRAALEAIADCVKRLSTLLPDASASVAMVLGHAITSLAATRQSLEQPGPTGFAFPPGGRIVGGY